MIIAKQVSSIQEREHAFSIRKVVFVEEQGVPIHLELDEFEDVAIHFISYDGEIPFGAGRVRDVGDKKAKIERVCILPEYRGKYLGNLIMEKMEQFAKESGFTKVVLHSQAHAIPFYEKLNYVITSPEFYDAGIPHRAMEKYL